jgi:predicted GNAT family N-acyltransferase
MSATNSFRATEMAPLTNVHGPFTPHDVRPNETISALVTHPTTGEEIEVQVWRLSPIGLELVDPSGRLAKSKNASIDLKLQMGQQISRLEGLIVDEQSPQGQKTFVCVRLTAPTATRADGTERRKSNRWLCSDQFYPTAVASNPAKYNDFIYFKIKDLSRTGMRLTTSLRNKFIIKGLTFDCLINFPMVTQTSLKIRIENVSVTMEDGKEVLSVGASFDASDKKIFEAISQYVFQFGNLNSIEELRNEGMNVGKVTTAVEFGFARTKEEYDQVLELRRLAYAKAGKVSETTKAEDMADLYDARARIVIGKYKGEVVACARLTFSEFEDRMEQENYVDWPDHLPRRDEMVEVMRACTRPDFKGTDLLLALFRFMALSVVQSKRQWIVICATDELTPLYLKIGFQPTGLSYNHPKLNQIKHSVFIANVPAAMTGKGVSPLYWNVVWGDLAQYLEDYDLIDIDPAMNVRLSLYRLFKPFAMLVRKLTKKRSMRPQGSIRKFDSKENAPTSKKDAA